MYEISSENLSLICKSFNMLQEFEVEYAKKYPQPILTFFWVVYCILDRCSIPYICHIGQSSKHILIHGNARCSYLWRKYLNEDKSAGAPYIALDNAKW